jgi:gas vesicle protein
MNLSNLDPNVVLTWGGIAAAATTWLIAKARGNKTQSGRDILDSIVTQVINAPGVDLENVKDRVSLAARLALKRIGLKGAIVETLVHEAAEYALAQLHERFDLVTRELAKLAKATEKVKAEFETVTTVSGEITQP